MKKIVLTEMEQRDLDLLKEDIEQQGGMTTEELIKCLNAIPFEDFINNLREKVRNCSNGDILSAIMLLEEKTLMLTS